MQATARVAGAEDAPTFPPECPHVFSRTVFRPRLACPVRGPGPVPAGRPAGDVAGRSLRRAPEQPLCDAAARRLAGFLAATRSIGGPGALLSICGHCLVGGRDLVASWRSAAAA